MSNKASSAVHLVVEDLCDPVFRGRQATAGDPVRLSAFTI